MYRRYRMPGIWREMDQLQRGMDRLVDSSFGSRSFSPLSFPAINIWTGEEEMIVSAELPGIKISDIDLNISADTLVLSGERKPEALGEDARYHRQERNYGKFNRSIQLPFMVDPAKAKAEFRNGILEISLVRAEADKPRKIAVKAG
jgi:HSP20 family protein